MAECRMRVWVGIVAMAVVAGPAAAQPDVVVLPRDVAQAAAAWVGSPDPTMAVKLYAALTSCLQNNPDKDGKVMRQGQDQCPVVTEALAARNKEIEELRKQAEAHKAAEAEPEKKE